MCVVDLLVSAEVAWQHADIKGLKGKRCSFLQILRKSGRILGPVVDMEAVEIKVVDVQVVHIDVGQRSGRSSGLGSNRLIGRLLNCLQANRLI